MKRTKEELRLLRGLIMFIDLRIKAIEKQMQKDNAKVKMIIRKTSIRELKFFQEILKDLKKDYINE